MLHENGDLRKQLLNCKLNTIKSIKLVAYLRKYTIFTYIAYFWLILIDT